jgi:SAM-dependent methyltransferase
MPENVGTCPLCGSGNSRSFDRREFRGRPVINRLCQNCGLVYQSPRMTEAEADVFYAEEYRLLNEGSDDPTSRNLRNQRGRAESLYTFIQPFIPAVRRHLDIGCSTGILLQYFQGAYHNQTVGVEPGEAHRNQARKEGLTVYATLEDLEKAGEARFELVSMLHVLEHLPDPVGYLVHLRETQMDEAGWLLLEVPNLYAHDSFEVAHLISYSRRTLIQTLEKAGFEIIKLEQHGRPRSKLLQLYLIVLARPLPEVLQTRDLLPEKHVMFKRRAGMFRRRLLERLFPKQAWLA